MKEGRKRKEDMGRYHHTHQPSSMGTHDSCLYSSLDLASSASSWISQHSYVVPTIPVSFLGPPGVVNSPAACVPRGTGSLFRRRAVIVAFVLRTTAAFALPDLYRGSRHRAACTQLLHRSRALNLSGACSATLVICSLTHFRITSRIHH